MKDYSEEGCVNKKLDNAGGQMRANIGLAFSKMLDAGSRSGLKRDAVVAEFEQHRYVLL